MERIRAASGVSDEAACLGVFGNAVNRGQLVPSNKRSHLTRVSSKERVRANDQAARLTFGERRKYAVEFDIIGDI